MKKSLLALAALTAFAGAASAQSSVTLFGIVDLAVRNQKNGDAGSITSLSHSGVSTSRLGLRGVEDLGGGLRAGFWLEGALVPDTGTPGGQTWTRRSTVSLMGGFGEIRLGRDYVPTFWNHTVFDPFGTNGVGNANNLITQQGQGSPLNSGATTQTRANNTVGYFLPSGIGGLYGQVQIAAGEGIDTNKYQGFRLGYGAGPVNVAVAYGRTDLGATDLKEANIGGSFDAGFATFMAQYSKFDFGSVDQKNYMLGAAVPIGAGTFKISYGKAKGNGAGSGDASQVALGYVYDLSKRTALYAAAARISNDNGSRFVTSDSGPNNPISGQNSTGYEFGVRHSF